MFISVSKLNGSSSQKSVSYQLIFSNLKLSIKSSILGNLALLVLFRLIGSKFLNWRNIMANYYKYWFLNLKIKLWIFNFRNPHTQVRPIKLFRKKNIFWFRLNPQFAQKLILPQNIQQCKGRATSNFRCSILV